MNNRVLVDSCSRIEIAQVIHAVVSVQMFCDGSARFVNNSISFEIRRLIIAMLIQWI
jgi:hypothetical protein